MKHKKHDKLVKDYSRQKMKEMDRLATKLLKNDEKNQKLKTYSIKDPFNLFDDDSAKDNS
jgi:hypothetical protein